MAELCNKFWSPNDGNEDMKTTVTNEKGEDTKDTSSEDRDEDDMIKVCTSIEESEKLEDNPPDDEGNDEGSASPYNKDENLRDTSCDDELRTAGNAEFVLNQNLNTKSTELISVLIIEDHVDANPGAESELGEAVESRGIKKNHEIGLQQSKAQTYGNKYMGKTTSDDEKEDIEKTSSDSKNHVENTSPDD